MEKGLEVNGSEIPGQMQIKCYILADDLEEREKNQNKYLQTCDVVCIYNRDADQMLSVQKR